MKSSRLRGLANFPLRQVMLLAAKYDILQEPGWIKSEANGLADALSRFNSEVIADLCPYWQLPLATMLHPSHG